MKLTAAIAASVLCLSTSWALAAAPAKVVKKAPGYIDVKFQKAVYTMKPVQSSTGALRLEDVKGKTLWLQIANKSMLMDVKAGHRIVDGCTHASQREAMAK